MKIGILTGSGFEFIGGAERLILDLAEALSGEVVAPSVDPGVIGAYGRAGGASVRALGRALPAEPFRQPAGMRLFSGADLDRDYDFLVCIDDMAVRAVRHGAPHLYYMLTPRRAMYDMYYHYLASVSPLLRPAYRAGLNVMKYLDRRFVNHHVKELACISHNVRNRIFKAYLRDARVLYPPVRTSLYRNREPEPFWLSVGRVDKWKRIELQIEAFRQIPERQLRVVGQVYPGYRDLVTNSPPNVEFLGNVKEDELRDLYSRCEGFVTTAIDEDFGYTPVEAMASGKPVVATKEGGYLETVIDGETGILVGPDPDEIEKAVRKISADPVSFADRSLQRAKRFDYDLFARQARMMVEESARRSS
ncbi:glycosyltransferase involved in cell wall biosynthesis [Methanolinea mesophila]|uniref:glycosyltransferase n=1 Tax=Methanolinea mesophila TaxID=547055 RepID=UPI001AE74D65|nr:glycosyltransferase involved in cell wall biosynthesis [Methanolinea mesophila]